MLENELPFPNQMDLVPKLSFTYTTPVNNIITVTFTYDEIDYVRDINVVLVDDEYDEKATVHRIIEISNTIKNKIEAGVLNNISTDSTPGD